VSLLVVRGLEVRYGGIRAVKGIDLEVRAGEVVSLIGANGAGKSTTLRALAGLVPVAAGQALFDAVPLAGVPTHRRVGRGLALVPEGRGVFARLTVEENLLMGAYARADRPAMRQDLERAYALFPRLGERRSQTAGTLSGGEQQMLAIGRALMGRPRLLMLDEPSLGLAPLLVEKIFGTLQAVAAEGVTLLLVEQNARRALELADRAYVLESGRVALTGDAASLLADPRVRTAYLGADVA
jgi:branched-chain amino acid transport system ATP-binding protein